MVLERADFPHIVVVGAGYAGLICALRAGKALRGRARVTLVTAEPHLVERIRLHEAAAYGRPVRHEVARFLRRTKVALRIGRVRAIDPERRRLDVEGEVLSYRYLVLALGSRGDRGGVPGVAEFAYGFEPDGPRGASALAQRLAELAARPGGGRVLIAGGGLTGVEGASEIAERYPNLAVTLATAGVVAPMLSKIAQAHARATLVRLGVELREHTRLVELESGAAHFEGGPVPDHAAVPYDAVVHCGGFVAPPLAREAGIAVNARGQVVVDAMLRSRSHPEILAAGDCAFVDADVGCPITLSCKLGMPLGAHAADVLVALVRGHTPLPFRFADAAYCVSLGRRDGVVDLRYGDGSPRERVFTGRFAAFVKERICRYTVTMLRLERLPLLRYVWMRSAPTPRLGTTEPSRLTS